MVVRLRNPGEAVLTKCKDLQSLIREIEAATLEIGDVVGGQHDSLIQASLLSHFDARELEY